jgi:hypothetical protein
MKRNLLTLAALASLCAGAQTTVTNTNPSATGVEVVLYVGDSTIYHDKGQIKVISEKAQIQNRGRITAEGGVNVKNDGKANAWINGGWAKTNQFLNEYYDKSGKKYGQLKVGYNGTVGDGGNGTGEVAIEQVIGTAQDAAFVLLGLPFDDFTGNHLTSAWNSPYNLYDAGCLFEQSCLKWGNVSVYTWDNKLLRFDPLEIPKTTVFATGDGLTAGGFYQINVGPYSSNFKNDKGKTAGADVGGLLSGKIPQYRGKLKAGDITFTVPDSIIIKNLKIGDKANNIYNIFYYTYVVDPFNDASFTPTTTNDSLEKAKYAQGWARLSNPFASNLNVGKLVDQDVTGVAFFKENSAFSGGNNVDRYTIEYVKVKSANGTSWTEGDLNNLVVAPMHVFEIKATPNTTIAFRDATHDLQVFAYTYNAAEKESAAAAPIQKLTAAAKKTYVANTPYYQVGLELNNSTKEVAFNHTYVSANKKFITGPYTDQAPNTAITAGYTGVYTLSELPTGGIDPAKISTPLYINRLSTDSKAVAIPVGIAVNAAQDGTQFAFTAKLYQDGKILAGEKTGNGTTAVNYADPSAKFIFHDKKENKFIDIDSNFSYAFTQDSSTNDRFEIFWSDVKTLGNEDIQTLNGVTTVYKSGDDYKVRFDQNWKSATVTIFNSVGQIVSSQANVDAQNDYVLPLRNGSSTLYVVKIVNEKGDVVTKKVVK